MRTPWDSCIVSFDLDQDAWDNIKLKLRDVMLPLPEGWEIADADGNSVEFEVTGPVNLKDGLAVEKDLVQLGLRPKPR